MTDDTASTTNQQPACRHCGVPIVDVDGTWVVLGTGTSADGLSFCPPDPDREPAGDHEPRARTTMAETTTAAGDTPGAQVSRYTSDPRVVLGDDGGAVLPDPGGYPGPPSGDWHVQAATGGGYTLRNDGGDQGYVTDEGDRYHQRPKVFDTTDDAIAYVIGEPAADTPADDDTDGM